MKVRVLRLNEMPLPTAQAVSPNGCPRSVCHKRENAPDSGCAVSMYRDRTILLLRRYLRLALEAGRLPSLLGREFFRARITGYQTQTFEDIVIFVHDVERSLEELDGADRQLIAMIVLQEHSQHEAARLLGYTRRTVVRRYAQALDRVSKIFLQRHIMERFAASNVAIANCCQARGGANLFVNGCARGRYNP